jgi:hypothetical protein
MIYKVKGGGRKKTLVVEIIDGCPICRMKYNSKGGLYKHLKTHTYSEYEAVLDGKIVVVKI